MAIDITRYGRSANLREWQFRQYHVAADRGGLNQGSFLTSEATLLAAGPPRFEDMGVAVEGANDVGTRVVPIGITENASVNQNRMLQQVFEIGSRRSYFVSGHTTGGIALSRLLVNGPSLMRVLTSSTRDHSGLDTKAGIPDVPTWPAPTNAAFHSTAQWYINLQAEIFDRNMGILIYFIDQRNNPFGACYLEDCVIQGHSFNLASQAIAVSENVSLMFDRIVPVSVSAAGS